jgi:TatD DNase family protein
LHPTSIDATWREEMNFLYDHIDDNPICAIGEIGLDEYWSREFIDEQMDIFAEQLLIAHERDLPVIIHSRESTEDIFKVLDRVGKELRGVFHAYSGSFETYQRVKRYGDFKIGIGGVVTYKNSNLPKVVERVPLCDILLETDAPWLTPVPHRGERNESSYVKYVAQKIALIKGVSEDEVRRVTTQNAKSLFNI